MADGHAAVAQWPLARLWAEYDLHKERKVERVRSDALAMYQAAAAVMGGKAALPGFNKWLDGLSG